MNSNRTLSFRSAALGAAVSIAGMAYFGTLIGNIAVSIYMRQGMSVQEAYALLNRFDLSVQMVLGQIIDVVVAVLCGCVAAAHGKSRPIAHGALAGLIAVSFPAVMLFGPLGGPAPLWFSGLSLAVPVLGSIAGASIYGREA